MTRLLLAAAVVGLLCWAELWPGDIPLNDDWSYGEGVRHLLVTGRFYLPTVCASGFPHVVLGALFSKVLGFSYGSLRLASLTMTLLGVIAFYLSARLVSRSRSLAMWFTAVYALNPILVNVCFSFMSDSSGLALNSIFIYLALLTLKKDSRSLLSAASLALVLGTLVRQSSILLSMIFLPRIFQATDKRLNRWCYLFALVPPLYALGFADNWLAQRAVRGELLAPDYELTKEAHYQFTANFITACWPQLVSSDQALFVSFCYLGLFCLPLLPFLIGGLLRDRTRLSSINFLPSVVSTIILALAGYQSVIIQGATMPFCENIWRVTSIGAQGIMGISHPVLTASERLTLTLFSALAACLLLTLGLRLLFSLLKHRSWLIGNSLIALCATAIGFIALETAVRATDRYDLFALAPCLLCLLLLSRYLKVSPGGITRLMILLFGIYSVCGCEDYLASNKARFQLISRLEKQGATFKEIDGGAEYNIQKDLNIYGHVTKTGTARDHWRWWPIHGEKYIVSFSPVPGYREIMHQSFFSFLSLRQQFVLLLERETISK